MKRMLLQERVVKLRITKPKYDLVFQRPVILKEQLKGAGEFPPLFYNRIFVKFSNTESEEKT